MNLPNCLSCHENEVKPGEVDCWVCLGEQEPRALPDYYVTGYSPNTTATHFYPVSVGTNNTATYHYVGNGSLTINGIGVGKVTYTIPSVTLVGGDTLEISFNGMIWG